VGFVGVAYDGHSTETDHLPRLLGADACARADPRAAGDSHRRWGQGLLRRLPQAPAIFARVLGIKRSNMNPDICTVCELMFEKVMRKRNIEVDLTILFADLRGYTEMSEAVDQDRLQALLDFFYDECAVAIWEHDGLLNKTIGDAVMAIFNFPLRHPDHPIRAVRAAREIQRRCAERGWSRFASSASSES
jgi:hypothetical protein